MFLIIKLRTTQRTIISFSPSVEGTEQSHHNVERKPIFDGGVANKTPNVGLGEWSTAVGRQSDGKIKEVFIFKGK